MKQNNVLYILCRARVAAINKKDGAVIWEVKLGAHIGITGQSIGQLYIDGDKLFIGIKGMLLCLSAKDGALLWKNELKGWGYGFVSMANVNADGAAAQVALDAAANSAAAAG
ncbi:outer membrane protein assembly factor BamB family protein [Ferruginibacter sp.]